MRKSRNQRAAQIEIYKEVKEADSLVKVARKIVESLMEWESNILETRSKGGQDLINYAGKLNVEFFYLYGYIDVADPRVTEGAKERLSDLEKQWSKEKSKLSVIREAIAKYNALVRTKQIDAVPN
jgi:hypothetical protein